ncbi:UbiA prenyltransferase [Trametes elegans]|nr:UbiA prenyltransferase [Trametes elegans]
MALTAAQARGYFELTRLHKPLMGNTYLFWPCAWGLTIAARNVALPLEDYVVRLVLFFIGGMLIHSANCVYNDICDIEFDRQVERTRKRPLAAGVISVKGAVITGVSIFLPNLYLITLMNDLSFKLSLIGMFLIHPFYPLMKRWTYWPQAWLGLSFNWGIVVGWVCVHGRMPPPALWVMVFGGVCWTILYDTIYAVQDREDDKRIGVKSTAVLFGDSVKPILAIMAAIFISALAYSGKVLGQSSTFLLVSCGGALLHSIWQLTSWSLSEYKDHRAKFEVRPITVYCSSLLSIGAQSNGAIACLVWLGLFVDYYRVL